MTGNGVTLVHVGLT